MLHGVGPGHCGTPRPVGRMGNSGHRGTWPRLALERGWIVNIATAPPPPPSQLPRPRGGSLSCVTTAQPA